MSGLFYLSDSFLLNGEPVLVFEMFRKRAK